jgi:hypothetical protein
MKIRQPFHSGEISIQTEVNERSIALSNGSLYEDAVILPAHSFLTRQFFFVLSLVEDLEHIPITVIYGEPGFISINNSGEEVTLSLKSHSNQNQDPVLRHLIEGSRVGGLAIELSTRRRLRINGHIKKYDAHEVIITVDESYPNCPMYIQKRTMELQAPTGTTQETHESGQTLQPHHLDLIIKSDTFFVSSMNPQGHADASHRGGNPGFVEVLENGDLKIPDYPGNSLFNTFGNLKLNPHAGLIFWNFERAEFLHLYGSVQLDFHLDEKTADTGGTGRWWIFTTQAWESQTVNLPFKIHFQSYSSYNP